MTATERFSVGCLVPRHALGNARRTAQRFPANLSPHVVSLPRISPTSPHQTPTMPQPKWSDSSAIGTYTPSAAKSIDHIRKRVSPAPMRMPSRANTSPFSGCISANSGQIACSAVEHRRVAGERVREHVDQREHHAPNTRADQRPTSRSSAARRRRPPRRRRPRACARRSPGRRWPPHPAPAPGRPRAGTRSGGRRASRADAREHRAGHEERARTARPCARRSRRRSRASGRIRASAGRRVSAGARSSSEAKAAPIPACAITVPHAEPARPQSKP